VAVGLKMEGDNQASINVCVRLRPLNSREARCRTIVHADEAERVVAVDCGYGETKQYSFDSVFGPASSQVCCRVRASAMHTVAVAAPPVCCCTHAVGASCALTCVVGVATPADRVGRQLPAMLTLCVSLR
jgi:hypothetical protein